MVENLNDTKLYKHERLKKKNSKIKITTWNVNSVRKRTNSIKVFIESYSPDILAIQETKVRDNLFPEDFFRDLGYNFIYYHGESTGYNGVAILAKIGGLKKIPKIDFIKEARHLAVKIGRKIELHNFYIPAGGDIPDSHINEKFKYKLEFLDKLKFWFQEHKSCDDHIILLGDLNIAPLNNDVWSHKQLINTVSHTSIEIEKMNALLGSINFKDVVRKFSLDSEKIFSWWSYRAKDWKKSDRGRRLDHIWVTDPLYSYVVQTEISKYTRDLEVPSDHVPVSITILFNE